MRQDNNNNKSRKKKISFSEMFSTKTKLVAYINPNLTHKSPYLIFCPKGLFSSAVYDTV